MRRLVLLGLAIAGCARSYTAQDIELSIGVEPGVADSEVATVQTLDVSVTGDASATMSYRLGRPLARTERVVVHFTTAKGHVTVSVLARDGQSLIAMRGSSGDIDLEVGGAHKGNVLLRPLAGGAHLASAINLVPQKYTVFTGQTLQLATDGEPVTWSATDGGSVDANGLFTAPATAGTYHVLARSGLYPTDQGSVTIDVLGSGIARYAGKLGGQGSVDGTGAVARINLPSAMALEPSGVIYFTDAGSEVRKLDPTTGAVTTVAGRPDYAATVDGAGAGAGFNVIGGLASDGNGTLYVADSACPCLRSVAIATGQTTTVAGKPYQNGNMDGVGAAAQMSWPNAMTWDAAKKLLYFADNGNQLIRTFDPATAKVTTIAGVAGQRGGADGPAASATFNDPRDLVLDGNVLYLFEPGNRKVRALDLVANKVTTLTNGVDGSVMASAGPGKLMLGSPFRSIDVTVGQPVTLMPAMPTNDSLLNDWLTAFVLAPDGTVYAAPLNGFAHYDISANQRTLLAGIYQGWTESDGARTSAGISSFETFAVRSDGVIFGADNRIFRIDPNGQVTTVVPWTSGPRILDSGGQMSFAADGKLYAANWNQQTVVRIDVDAGTVSTVAGTQGVGGYADGVGTAAKFSGIQSVAADGNKLYVTESDNNIVRAIDLSTVTVTTLAGTARMCGYVDMPGSQARFCGVQGIVADGNGALYVTSNNVVRKIVIATAAVSTLAGDGTPGFVDGPAASARFWNPTALTLDPAKKYLYVADAGNDAIRRVEIATGMVTTIAGAPGKTQVAEGPLPGAVNRPGTLGFAATGELLVAVPREENLLQIRLP